MARFLAACLLLAPSLQAVAAPCAEQGLLPTSRMIVELREAAQTPRDADVWRSADERFWFIPVHPDDVAAATGICLLEGQALRRVAEDGDTIIYDAAAGVLSFVDRSRANYVLDLRQRNVAPTGAVLPAVGMNYQLNAAINRLETTPSAQVELFGFRNGWYASTTMGLAPGKSNRFETYALREDIASAVSLRLGDSTTGPTVLGEAMRFGGVSWGTDISLQPADFAPVLPDLRGGNVTPGPMELFINDALQFQQTLKSGVYDLRNIPAQQGFNSYRVRTVDAFGNLVTVVREIYLPLTLLPPGVSTWRVDAGLQRRNFLSSNFDYGAAVVSGSYARGIDYDSTASVYALVTRKASAASVNYDRRLSDLWTGHVGVHAARTSGPGGDDGWAWRLRVEGGAKRWRALAETLVSPGGLPGLEAGRGSLYSQQILRAQWIGWSSVTPGVTVVRTHRDFEGVQQVATLFATVRPFQSAASLTISVSKLRSASVDQTSALVALLVPLDTRAGRWRCIAPATQPRRRWRWPMPPGCRASAIDGSGSQWTAALNHDSRNSKVSADASWSGQTSVFELAASARAAGDDVQAQLSARSGMLWTQGSLFFSRPVGGAFALVKTSEPGVMIYHDNRPVGRTNASGVALVPGLRPLEANGLSINPLDWPIEWTASDVNRKVVAPRGGGVAVSFRINKDSWPEQSIVELLDQAGEPYPSGTEVYAMADQQKLTGVVNSKGMLWLGDLMPATTFRVRKGLHECEYAMPKMSESLVAVPLRPVRCERAV